MNSFNSFIEIKLFLFSLDWSFFRTRFARNNVGSFELVYSFTHVSLLRSHCYGLDKNSKNDEKKSNIISNYPICYHRDSHISTSLHQLQLQQMADILQWILCVVVFLPFYKLLRQELQQKAEEAVNLSKKTKVI